MKKYFILLRGWWEVHFAVLQGLGDYDIVGNIVWFFMIFALPFFALKEYLTGKI